MVSVAIIELLAKFQRIVTLLKPAEHLINPGGKLFSYLLVAAILANNKIFVKLGGIPVAPCPKSLKSL